MNVAQLRACLEHLPDDLAVYIAGRGEVQQVRRHRNDPWVICGVHLDAGDELRLAGPFKDRKTLEVRLEALA